jgi:hypothetical protein
MTQKVPVGVVRVTEIVHRQKRLRSSTYREYENAEVKLSLRLTKLNTMKTYWGSGGIALRIL